MTDIRTSSLKSPVDVAQYLFTRLHQIGVKSIHGVPGDYNLVALDYIDKAGLKWVGNVNELNAGKYLYTSRYMILLADPAQDTQRTDTPESKEWGHLSQPSELENSRRLTQWLAHIPSTSQ